MGAPTTLTVTMQDSTVVTVSIPTALQNLESAQTTSTQSGYDSVEVLISSIYKRGFFYDSTRSTAYSTSYIKNITWS